VVSTATVAPTPTLTPTATATASATATATPTATPTSTPHVGSLVQVKACNKANANSSSCSFNSTPTAGNAIVVDITVGSSSTAGDATVGSVSMSGCTFARGPHREYSSGASGLTEEQWYCTVGSSPASQVTVTTSNATGTAGDILIMQAEYSGYSDASHALVFDQGATNSGNLSITTGSTGTTSAASELLVAGFAQYFGAGTACSSPTNFFTVEANTGNVGGQGDKACLSDRMVTSTGSYSTGVTMDAYLGWSAIVGTYY